MNTSLVKRLPLILVIGAAALAGYLGGRVRREPASMDPGQSTARSEPPAPLPQGRTDPVESAAPDTAAPAPDPVQSPKKQPVARKQPAAPRPGPKPKPEPLLKAVTNPDNPLREWRAVNELSGPQPPEATAALAGYLTDNPIGEGMHHNFEFGHRNFIMDVLRDQRGALPQVVDAFVRVYEDPKQGDVMRGYALQHLTSLQIDPARRPNPAQRGRIVETLRSALSERQDGTLAATALVGLHEIALTDAAGVSPAEVERIALELLHDPESGDLTRISALHVAGERRLSGAVTEARRLAADPAADWVVRMAAAWLIGQTGADTALLRNLTQDPNENVRGAALAALAGEVP